MRKSLKGLRNSIGDFLFTKKFYKLGCFVRGSHIGQQQVGRCLACGKPAAWYQTTLLRTPAEIRLIETTYERNQRIRRQAKEHGL